MSIKALLQAQRIAFVWTCYIQSNHVVVLKMCQVSVINKVPTFNKMNIQDAQKYPVENQTVMIMRFFSVRKKRTLVSRPIMYSNMTFRRYSNSVCSVKGSAL